MTQAEHVAAPTATWNRPAMQGVQDDAPVPANRPTAHLKQRTEPVKAAYMPVPQFFTQREAKQEMSIHDFFFFK